MLIVYVGEDEVIVTTTKRESETVKLFFIEGGRDLDLYNRTEKDVDGWVHVKADISAC